ncbi:uncharacterized protein DUF4402 [Sphingobium sp. AEW010]|nr:hypothetical protein [Sphingobium sp. JAI105]PSO11077.1 hypothetical protein C7E20_13895 [Sphingobium sp. AEW4]TWD05582.1 uncharacterized protein DUF4402 [Sphingobium sp. AEW010]TWD22467.1 uncharacterized protein DUF4402 [Sphingobium sp. AEW013]TWD24990.1 uncharacterized protein DUF4402 [Sphingobium sp. AEW001]
MRDGSIISYPLMRVILFAGAMACSSLAMGQTANAASGGAAVTILRSLSATQEESLDFGRILPAAQDGIVTVRPDGGTDCSGAMLCLGKGKPALFRLTGSDSPLFVSIDPAVAMMGPDAASLMVTLLPSGPVTTASPAGASYAVGGQMIVTAGTPPGSYAGQYNISFEYQ